MTYIGFKPLALCLIPSSINRIGATIQPRLTASLVGRKTETRGKKAQGKEGCRSCSAGIPETLGDGKSCPHGQAQKERVEWMTSKI